MKVAATNVERSDPYGVGDSDGGMRSTHPMSFDLNELPEADVESDGVEFPIGTVSPPYSTGVRSNLLVSTPIMQMGMFSSAISDGFGKSPEQEHVVDVSDRSSSLNCVKVATPSISHPQCSAIDCILLLNMSDSIRGRAIDPFVSTGDRPRVSQ